MNIKRIFSLILALAMVFALASCGKKQPEIILDDSDDTSDGSVSDLGEGDESINEAFVNFYYDIIDHYENAISENWTREQLEEAGLSPMVLDSYKQGNTVGWILTDQNNDGIDELVIGCTTPSDPYFDQMIFQMYVVGDDEAELLFESSERNRWYWHDIGQVLNTGSDSAFKSYWYLCTADRELAFIDCVEYDESGSADEPWSSFDGEKWNPVTEEDAFAIIDELEARVTDLELVSFTIGNNDDDEEEGLDVDENGYAVEDGMIIGFVSDATETVTPENADTIADAAFSSDFGHGENLEKVRITGNIKYIQEGAFSFTAADDIYMEEGVEFIGSYAFSDSYITDIWFPASVTEIGVSIMETEEGLSGCTIHVVKDSVAAKYFEENMPYGDATLAYDYQ